MRCTVDQDCSGTTPNCDPATHTCVCRRTNIGNLVNNPGFDLARGLGGWSQVGTDVTFSNEDSEGCSGSGSARSIVLGGTPFQCVPVAGSTRYFLAGKFKTDDATGSAFCDIFFYSDATCRDFLENTSTIGGADPAVRGWQSTSTTLTTAFAVRGIVFQCTLERGNMDEIYLNPNFNGY